MEDEEVLRLLKQARSAMEEKYHVRVSDEALKLASFHALGPFIIYEDAIPAKAVKILEAACKLVLSNFKNNAYESELCDNEYVLRRAMAEHKELYRDIHLESQSWVARVERERNYAAFYLDAFLNNWDLILIHSGGKGFLGGHVAKVQFYASQIASLDRRLAEEGISEDLTDRFKESVKLVSEFLEDLYQRLIRYFLPLLTVKPCHVAEVVSRLTDVPLTHTLGPSISSLKEKAIYKTKQMVVNQDDVIDGIFKIVAGPRHMTMRPRGSFLLLGPPGVGKREIAKAIAEHWYCDERRLVEIDMSEYAEPQLGSASCGLSQWSKGRRQHLWRRLTDAVKVRSYSVILLDKIDKVSSSVTEVLLDVLGNDAPSDCEGNPVDFSNSIIFMTSSVGVEQLHLACNCLVDNRDFWIQFKRDPKAFQMIHNCVRKGSRNGRVITEARKFFSADLLESVDRLFVVEKFRNWKAVSRLLLRKIVSNFFGSKFVVHASDAALAALLLKASTEFVGNGKALRKSLHEHVVPHLFAAERDENTVVCVDTLVGTRELSFRFQAYEKFMEDWFLEQKDGSFGKLIVNLRMKLESIYNIFELRTKCLPLLHGSTGQDFTELGKYLLAICNSILMFSPFRDQPIKGPYKKRAPCNVAPDHLPTVEEKEKIINLCRRGQENESGWSKQIRAIVGGAMKLIDDPLPFPDLPVRSYLFLGLHGDPKLRLINELTESSSYGSGKSLFKYVKLEENNCSGEVQRRLLIEAVKEKPGMVVMLDGVEYADGVFYESLLKIFDYGTLYDDDGGEGLSVDFRKTIIILVSEAANLVRIAKLFNRRLVMQQRQNVKRFRTELLHRVDDIIFFDPGLPNRDLFRLSKRDPLFRKGPNNIRLPEFLFGVFEQKHTNDPIPPLADKEVMDPAVKCHLSDLQGMQTASVCEVGWM